MFDLTWFCSHMFSTSGEHPLLPFLSLSFAWVGCRGVPAAVQVWADTLGRELAAYCTGRVQQSLPGQYLPPVYENAPLFQPGLPSFWLNLTFPSREIWVRGHFFRTGGNLAVAEVVHEELVMPLPTVQV